MSHVTIFFWSAVSQIRIVNRDISSVLKIGKGEYEICIQRDENNELLAYTILNNFKRSVVHFVKKFLN